MHRLINILLFCCLSWTAMGQPRCMVTCYDEQNGVPSRHITQLLQDDQGFMWFATWNGLCRFDGYEFVTFKPQAGDGCHMPTDRIRNISSLPDGTILCRVEDSDYLFDLRSYRFRDIDSIRAEYAEDQLMKYRKSRSLLNREGYSWTDRCQTVWTISSDGRLTYRLKDSSDDIIYPLSAIQGQLTFAMVDRDDNLWALDDKGINRFSTDISYVQRIDIVPREEVKCLFADRQGRYWVTTKVDAAIRIFDSATDRLLGFLGIDGRLHQQHTSFTAPVYSICEMVDGTIWLGTKSGGLFRLRSKADRYEIDHFTDIPHQDVYHMTTDRYGRLWVASLGGGICFTEHPDADQPHFVVPKHFKLEQCPRVRYLLCTDSLWMAATGSGLLIAPLERQADQMHFRLHQRETERANSLSSSATMDVIKDSQGRYYVSTESGGINMIESSDLLSDELVFRHFTDTLHIQHTDIIQSMTPLSNGGLMAIGSHLLTLIDSAHHSRILDTRHFQSDFRFSEAHPLLLNDGRWLVGLTDGAIMIRTEQLAADSHVPAVVLTGLSIQGGVTCWDVTRRDTLTLQSDERSLTIRFAALDYRASERINYAFRVLPNEQWNYIGHDRSATLLDMEPGTYQLQVRSTNADGEWQQNERCLTIIVTPTFWEAWYGQLLFVLLVCSFIGLVIYTYYYIKRIKRQQHEMLEAYLALVNEQGSSHVTSKPASQPESSALAPEDEAFMARVMEFIESHIADADANIGDMAEATATSKSSLTRKLKSIVGLTPADFLREARIKRAAQLLSDTNGSISDIAYHCGFADPKYFSKCFKASVGLTPSDYRNAKKG